jgi:hypothetical protein
VKPDLSRFPFSHFLSNGQGKKKRDNKKVGIKINFHFEIDKMVM